LAKWALILRLPPIAKFVVRLCPTADPKGSPSPIRRGGRVKPASNSVPYQRLSHGGCYTAPPRVVFLPPPPIQSNSRAVGSFRSRCSMRAESLHTACSRPRCRVGGGPFGA